MDILMVSGFDFSNGGDLSEYVAWLIRGNGYSGFIHAISTDDKFIYFGGSGSSNRSDVIKLNRKTFSIDNQSVKFNGTINEIVSYRDYLYIGLGIGTKIIKLDIATLSNSAESENFSASVSAMIKHNGNLYVGISGIANARKILKIDPSDMSTVASSTNYSGGGVQSIVSDGQYIYACNGSCPIIIIFQWKFICYKCGLYVEG